MSRNEKSNELIKQYFGDINVFEDDPELKGIYTKYVFGDVYNHGNLSMKLRELITIVVFTTNVTLETLGDHVKAALKVGTTPLEIKEAVYQCCPYSGFMKVLPALKIVNTVFKQHGIELPIESGSKTDEETRFQKGLSVQSAAFTEKAIQGGHDNAPRELKHIQNYLSEFCFGDFYTRKGLNLKTRELITLVMLATLGGCENQLRGHVGANIRVGNSREVLIEAITQCQPYIGFPRTLNAINIINEVTL